MSTSARFRRLTDLFTVGKAVELPDQTYLWVQALNAYQRDECISDAQVARSRMVMALRDKGDERLKIEGRFYENGRDSMIGDLAANRAQNKMGDVVDDLRADPDWKERMEILLRSDPDDAAQPMTIEEVELLAKVNREVMAEMEKRESDERDFITRTMSRQSDEEIIDAWTEDYLEMRGGERAQREYQLTETWYATRWCAATKPADSGMDLDHSECNAHDERVFADRQAVREIPSDLFVVIQRALVDLNMVGRDPKGSASNQSSSPSSPTPSAPEESTPSTSTDDPKPAPGTSPSPLPTPS
jgi:hypothetical protein